MNILITGCNGQLGNEMQLLQREHPAHQYFNTDVDELDITDQDAIEDFVEANHIDGIVNCAAYTAVDKAEANEELCQRLNADGTNCTPYTEDEDTCPNSVYGKTKLVGELNVQKLCQQSMIIRTAWLYSTFGNNFVKTMLRLGRERSELGVIFDQIGTPTYARDLAVAIFAAIEQGIKPGVYHFSNEGVISWYDFTKAIHRLAGISGCHVRPLHTAEYPTPAARPHYSVLDKSLVKKTFGVEIPHWRNALHDFFIDLLAY